MSSHEIANWLSLYLATFMCCALAMALTLPVVGAELYRDMIWRDARTWKGAALLVPRVWWRWQKRYLLSTPVTLGIVGAYACSLQW